MNTLFTHRNLIAASQIGISMIRPTPHEADPASWLQRSEEARREADLAPDPIDRDTLIGIANAYEKLVAMAEAKLAPKPDQHE